MINWQKVADQNGLTPEEFEKEILSVAACIGAMSLDGQKVGDHLRFTCYDDKGQIELWVRRLTCDADNTL